MKKILRIFGYIILGLILVIILWFLYIIFLFMLDLTEDQDFDFMPKCGLICVVPIAIYLSIFIDSKLLKYAKEISKGNLIIKIGSYRLKLINDFASRFPNVFKLIEGGS